jgi:hypothetical protein
VAAQEWEFDASAALYLLPDEEDFVQPTLRADRGLLHLEARYNYEDRHSTSVFAGWNLGVGQEAQLALTPMIGGLAGDTDGIVPGLEADFTYRAFEAYAEAEYVFDLEDRGASFLYVWSELGFRPREWFSAGLVAQRTRVYESDRDLQRGLFLKGSFRRLEGAVYAFNPGGDEHFTVLSLGLSF